MGRFLMEFNEKNHSNFFRQTYFLASHTNSGGGRTILNLRIPLTINWIHFPHVINKMLWQFLFNLSWNWASYWYTKIHFFMWYNFSRNFHNIRGSLFKINCIKISNSLIVIFLLCIIHLGRNIYRWSKHSY